VGKGKRVDVYLDVIRKRRGQIFFGFRKFKKRCFKNQMSVFWS
jgi:hypothetical protein